MNGILRRINPLILPRFVLEVINKFGGFVLKKNILIKQKYLIAHCVKQVVLIVLIEKLDKEIALNHSSLISQKNGIRQKIL